jgi:hypothetical protein
MVDHNCLAIAVPAPAITTPAVVIRLQNDERCDDYRQYRFKVVVVTRVMRAVISSVLGVVTRIIIIVLTVIHNKRLTLVGSAFFLLVGISFIELIVWIADIVPIIGAIIVDATIIFISLTVIVQRIIGAGTGVPIDRINIAAVVPASLIIMSVIVLEIAVMIAQNNVQVTMPMMFNNCSYRRDWCRR